MHALRSLGPIFADGNVNFNDFEHEHSCNVYCQHFRIAGKFAADEKGLAEEAGEEIVDMEFSGM